MAITQKDIIGAIPTYINAYSFDHLLSIQSLTAAGWGTQTKLYSYLSELVGISTYAGNKKYKFDSEKVSCSLINCLYCDDTGFHTPTEIILNDYHNRDKHKTSCTQCTANKSSTTAC